MTDLKVVEFPNANLSDIPGMMRKIADGIEAGEWGDVKFVAAVLVTRESSASTFGWGDCSPIEITGALAHGMSFPETLVHSDD